MSTNLHVSLLSKYVESWILYTKILPLPRFKFRNFTLVYVSRKLLKHFLASLCCLIWNVHHNMTATFTSVGRSIRIAATKHVDLNKNSYAVSYAFAVSFLLLQQSVKWRAWALHVGRRCSGRYKFIRLKCLLFAIFFFFLPPFPCFYNRLDEHPQVSK